MKISRLVVECADGVMDRRSRSALTVLGTLLGVGSFIAVLGLTTTANGQISEGFTKSAITQVKLSSRNVSGAQSQRFPDRADRAVERIDGVVAAGTFWVVNGLEVSRLQARFGTEDLGDYRITAVTPGFWKAVDAELVEGRLFDAFLDDQPVVIIGRKVADDLGIVDLRGQPVLYLSGKPFSVVGIVEGAAREEVTATSLTVPAGYARAMLSSLAGPDQMIISTEVGAGQSTADQAPSAVNPYEPGTVVAEYPPQSNATANAVSAQLRGLFLALAGVCLVIGGIGIVNVNLIAVMERISEIGLRRSLGAMPRHIIAQVVVEAGLLGLLGGLLGGLVGQLVIIGVSAQQGWTPTIEVWTVVVSAPAGALIGVLAALYPALWASRIEPVQAFRM